MLECLDALGRSPATRNEWYRVVEAASAFFEHGQSRRLMKFLKQANRRSVCD